MTPGPCSLRAWRVARNSSSGMIACSDQVCAHDCCDGSQPQFAIARHICDCARALVHALHVTTPLRLFIPIISAHSLLHVILGAHTLGSL